MATEESLNLSTLSPSEGSRRPRKRVGFGSGSGLGKTCGKGQKGQKSRSGAGIPAGFEGGQMPIHRRLPKRGFASRKRVLGLNTYSVVSIDRLAKQKETEFTIESLRKAGLVAKKPDRVKLLAGGAIDKPIKIEVHAASASARAAVEKAGGTVTIRKIAVEGK